jgi:hypothetical protein
VETVVTALKAEADGMCTTGSPSLVRSLFRLGLIPPFPVQHGSALTAGLRR